MPKDKKEKKSKKQKKAELEEKRRQEEELLRQQQEEERQRQEELERQRKEEEEKQRLLREKRRQEELARLEKESEEDVEEIERRQIEQERLIEAENAQSDWKKHLHCSSLRDISKERELNTFLTEWQEWRLSDHVDFYKNGGQQEQNIAFNMKHLDYYIADIESGYSLLAVLQEVILDAIQQHDETKLAYAKAKYLQIGQIAQTKLDQLTHKCLKDPLFASAATAGLREDGDVTKSAMKSHIKFGLWASSMSNAFKNNKIEYAAPLNIRIELPKQIAMKAKIPLSCRVTQYIHDFFLYRNAGQEFESVGPVINVELLRLPAPPKESYKVSKTESNAADTPTSSSGAAKENTSANAWSVAYVTEESDVPTVWEYANVDSPDPKAAETVSVAFRVPNYVLISEPEALRLGWWDSKRNAWRSEHFKDVTWDKATRMVSCVTSHLCPISVVQPKGAFYEYVDWKLTPCGVERCRISLLTKCAQLKNLEIEISGGKCRLMQPNIPELEHVLARKMMKPHELMRLLKQSGINLCYNNDEAPSKTFLTKNTNMELLTHIELSSVAALFEMSKSKWNRVVDDENIIIFRLRKPLSPHEKADLLQRDDTNDNGGAEDADNNGADDIGNEDVDSWQTVMIDHEKCTFIDCNESSAQVNMETPQRESSHKTLMRCLVSCCTDDNVRDLQNTSFRFKETIKRMLNLLHLFRV